MIVAPLINGFYTVLVASITLASAMELALRIVSDTEAVDAVQIIAAVSELLVVLVTSYGVVAAVLHGIHERQVLPGFDDALIETVLWKRPALKSKYSDGTWANPLPLGSICSSMGFVGMATLSLRICGMDQKTIIGHLLYGFQHGQYYWDWLHCFIVLDMNSCGRLVRYVMLVSLQYRLPVLMHKMGVSMEGYILHLL